jgi:hypothetical protein
MTGYLKDYCFMCKVLCVFFAIIVILMWVFKWVLFKPIEALKIVSTPQNLEVMLGSEYRYNDDKRVETNRKRGIQWSVSDGSPPEFTIDHEGVIGWKPTNPGQIRIGIAAKDRTGHSVEQKWGVTVLSKPIVKVPDDIKCEVNKQLAYRIEYLAWPDNVIFKLNEQSSLRGLKIDEKTGVISWKPSETGNFKISVSASNKIGESLDELNFQVVNPQDREKNKKTKESAEKNKEYITQKTTEKEIKKVSAESLNITTTVRVGDRKTDKKKVDNVDNTALQGVENTRQQREEKATELGKESKIIAEQHAKQKTQGISNRVSKSLELFNEAEQLENGSKADLKKIETIESRLEESIPEDQKDTVKKATVKAENEVKRREDQKATLYENFAQYRENMKTNDKTDPDPEPSEKSSVNNKTIRHTTDKKRLYSVTETKKILRESKNLAITLVWYEGQTRQLMDTFTDFGNAFAFLPPLGSFKPSDRIYLVEGQLHKDAEINPSPISHFYQLFSLRYILLSDKPGSFRDRIERVLQKKICPYDNSCSNFRMKLFLSYEFYRLVFSDATHFVEQHGFKLEKDIANVNWMLKVSGAEPWIHITSFTTHTGKEITIGN